MWLAVGDPGQASVEIVAGERALERSGHLAVVLAEAQQPLGQRGEIGEIVGGYSDAFQLRLRDDDGHTESRWFEVGASAIDVRKVS